MGTRYDRVNIYDLADNESQSAWVKEHRQRVLKGKNIGAQVEGQYDCVASTGNSLAYVANDEIPGVLEQVDALVKPGGYLCTMIAIAGIGTKFGKNNRASTLISLSLSGKPG